MNMLSPAKQAQIIAAICEGTSVRATARQCEVDKNTVARLVANVATAVEMYQDRAFRNLDIRRVECDEIWAFCTAKERHVPADRLEDPNYGDVWTWVAIDADTKLVPAWHVGDRSVQDCYAFLSNLRSRIKVGNRIQLTTDGFPAYPPVVNALWRNGIDYGVVVKDYGTEEGGNGRTSAAVVLSEKKYVVCGNPDPSLISTSYVERQNLTMRMNIRRYTRLTNGFSKKVESHAHATTLHYAYYNLVRPHMTLSKKVGRKTTPAMAAGVEKYPWTVHDLVALLDCYAVAA